MVVVVVEALPHELHGSVVAVGWMVGYQGSRLIGMECMGCRGRYPPDLDWW